MPRLELALADRRFLVLTLVFLALARVASGALPYALFYFTAGALLAAWAWSRYALGHISGSYRTTRTTYLAGERVEVEFRLYNESFLPVPWLELRDTSLTGAGVSEVRWADRGLGALESRVFHYSLGPLPRGVHTLGRVRVRGGDGLGLFAGRLDFPGAAEIKVYPRVHALDAFWIPAAEPMGRRRTQERSQEDYANLADVRPFAPGDNPKAIHWKLTAKRGELYVREYEKAVGTEFFVFLDLCRQAHEGLGAEGTEERAVEVAASIVRFALARAHRVVLAGQGSRPLRLGPVRGLARFGHFLETLVRVRADGEIPLSEVLHLYSRRLPRGATLVAVTADLTPALTSALLARRGAGFPCALVLLARETFRAEGEGPPPTGRDPALARLSRAGVGTYLLTRADRVAAVLGGAYRGRAAR